MRSRVQTRDPWRCPSCGREFRVRTLEHSCSFRSRSAHLDRASPEVKEAFAVLTGILDHLGPYELVPLKTMIVLSATSNFGGVTVRRGSLDLGFFLSRRLHHPR